MVGFFLTVVAHHHFVGDEGDPKDSEATMPGYDYFWGSAHAYGRGERTRMSQDLHQNKISLRLQTMILSSMHALVSFPPQLYF